jgi:transcriptional regulator with XRE-family HTH domain
MVEKQQQGSGERLLTAAQCQFARNKLGVTQAEVAKAAGVSRSQIANFETSGDRFTPSDEVRRKLRDYFLSEDPALEAKFDTMVQADDEDNRSEGSAVGSRTMDYIRRLTDVGCFRISAELTDAQRDRLLDAIERVRDELGEKASKPAKPGVFDVYDRETDELIAEADELIKAFGFLCIVAFGYGFVSLPSAALFDGRRKPATIADALALKHEEAFAEVGIRKNDMSRDETVDDAPRGSSKRRRVNWIR